MGDSNLCQLRVAPVDLIKLKFEGNFSANEQFAKWSAAHFFSNEDLR